MSQRMPRANDDPALPLDFVVLLRAAMERAGMGVFKADLATGLSHGYISRLLRNERHPSRETVEALATGLRLSPFERSQLLVSAGYAPVSYWTEAMQDVAETTRKLRFRETSFRLFDEAIQAACKVWRRAGG